MVVLSLCLVLPTRIAHAKTPAHKPAGGGVIADPPPIVLKAEATGEHKITLYWSSEDGARIYTIYRSTKTGGPYTKVKTAPVSIFPSNHANFCRYTDSGLQKKVEYFYYVLSSKNERSDEYSATPDLNAIPWDTDNPRQILTASAKEDSAIQGAPKITPDSPDLNVISPDRVTYHNTFKTFKGSTATAVGVPQYAPVKTGIFDVSTRDDAAVRQVWSKTNDGGDYVKATEWFPSPSDKYIVVVTGRKVIPILELETDLCLLSKQQGTNQTLTGDGFGYSLVRWNADEKQIAYLSQEGHYLKFDEEPINSDVPWTVYVQNIVSGKRTRLFKESALAPEKGISPLLEWIPQGAQILYSSFNSKGLLLLSADGTKAKRLATTSPDGIVTTAGLAYWHEDSKRRIRIARLPARTADWAKPETWQQITPFVTLTFPRGATNVTFSSAGLMAVLVPVIEGNTGPWASQLAVIDPVTRQARLLGVVPAEWCAALSWSPDGKRLILAQSETMDEGKQRSVEIGSAPQQSFDKLDWKSRTVAALRPIPFDKPAHQPAEY